MPLETPSFINDLTPTNPIAGDPRSEGDDHIRNLKAAILATFPGMAGRAWRSTSRAIAGAALAVNDNTTRVECTASLTLMLTAAATLGNGWTACVHAHGGDVTLDANASETINGALTLFIPDGYLALIYCDGTAFFCGLMPTNGGGAFSTGDVKLTLKTTADSGWVLMDDTTIGDATSGATSRANADTLALYTLLWTNTADADCAVSTGRGVSAAADFAAHKTIALPKALGRALATYGSGSGLTARALAHVVGSENPQAHTHTGTTGGQTADHTHPTPNVGNGGGNYAGGGNGAFFSSGNTSGSSNDHAHAFTTDVSGTGTAGNMQPTLFLNVMIKL